MTKTIWKFELPDAQITSVKMPEGAEIISLQLQNGTPHLWAVVDSQAPLQERYFEIVCTGGILPDATRNYINTYQTSRGLVFHVFELISLKPPLNSK